MPRRLPIAFLTLISLVAAVASATEPKAPNIQPQRPNILWLTVEDMSATLGCFGDEYADTPHLDALAEQSVTYTNAFATAPVCSPARSCLITGIYASSLGTQRLRSEFPLPERMRGFPALIRQLGYFTSNNVKTDYNTSSEADVIEASWNRNGTSAHWRDRTPEQPFFSVFNDMVTHQSRSMVWTFDHFRRDVQGRLPKDRRHDPADAPVPAYYPDTPVIRETIARFYDCVSVMDQNIGARLKELADDSLADNTIVFFYSDHGSGLPRHKRLLLDSGTHVPLMIRFPKKYQHLAPAEPGTRIDRLVSFVDFGPTVLSLLGIEPPKEMQGKPFLGKFAEPEREYVFAARDRVDEAFDVARSVRDKRYLYIRNYMPHRSYNQPSAYSDLGEIRDEITATSKAGGLTGALAHYAGPTKAAEELYDTQADPQNLQNLVDAPRHQDVLQRMRSALREWSHETRDVGLVPETEAWALAKKGPLFDVVRDDHSDRLRQIREAAELVGRDGVTARQVKLLTSPDPAVRYWAIIGLRVSGESPESLGSLLTDASAAVRIEAAAAVLDTQEDAEALAVLRRELAAEDSSVVLRAARALQLLGEKSRGAIPDIRAAQKIAADNPSPINLFIDFATTMHLVELGEIDDADAFASFR